MFSYSCESICASPSQCKMYEIKAPPPTPCTPEEFENQDKMRGQRGRLPVQALGYVNSTKVILGLPETAGVHFLLRPHHYILKVITQFRNGGPRANTSMEASFYGYIRERVFLDG